jgi:hypothetical protein
MINESKYLFYLTFYYIDVVYFIDFKSYNLNKPNKSSKNKNKDPFFLLIYV